MNKVERETFFRCSEDQRKVLTLSLSFDSYMGHSKYCVLYVGHGTGNELKAFWRRKKMQANCGDFRNNDWEWPLT